MLPRKTPTSSLSASELLVKRVWYRSLARIQRMRPGDTLPETSVTRTSPTTSLPLEVVREIVAHLFDDVRSLPACSLTCYSWYIAAVPDLHHMLFIDPNSWGRKLWWPNPILRVHVLGLFPLVRTLWIRGDDESEVFSSKRLNRSILNRFRALNNVRVLAIDRLDIPSFVPRIRRYFGHFLPTVQSLFLKEPRGSRREIIYFIGLFKHLEDLGLNYDRAQIQEEPVDDLTLIPSFAPPLQGVLTVTHFTRVGLLEDMIDLFGGVRFRHMNLFNVCGMRLLLDACAETLETLELDPTDPRGRTSVQNFDLSRNKSLQTLYVEAASIGRLGYNLPGTPFSLLKYTLSTITSPAFCKVTVVYLNSDFSGVELWPDQDQPPFREVSQVERIKEAALHNKRFEVLREIYKVRKFQLVLSACVWDPVGEYSVQMLMEAVAEEKAQNGFCGFLSEPSVNYYPLRSRYYIYMRY